MRILLIEDQDETALLIQEILKDLPHWHVDRAKNLDEGISLFNNLRQDVTLLDLGLPGSTTLQVIDSIPKFKESAIIVLTGNDQESAKKRALDNGADEFLSKGLLLDHKEFIRKIRRAFDILFEKGRKDVDNILKAKQEIADADFILIRKIPSLEQKVDDLKKGVTSVLDAVTSSLAVIREGQLIVQDTLRDQNVALADGKIVMQEIKTTTAKTNGRVNIHDDKIELLRSEVDSVIKKENDRAQQIVERAVVSKAVKAATDGVWVIPKLTWRHWGIAGAVFTFLGYDKLMAILHNVFVFLSQL